MGTRLGTCTPSEAGVDGPGPNKGCCAGPDDRERPGRLGFGFAGACVAGRHFVEKKSRTREGDLHL